MSSIHPINIERLANRIERLQQVSTHGWHPGDELEFRNQLPQSRLEARYKLPDPATLRDPEKQKGVTLQDYLNWTQRALRMETLIRNNDPRNPRRIIRDVIQGRLLRL